MNIIMPQLGETVEEGTVSVWHKKIGDQVSAGENLFDVTTDKVEMEIPSMVDGQLVEILVNAGETVAVGTTLAIINDGKEENSGEQVEEINTADKELEVLNEEAKLDSVSKNKIGKKDSKGKPLSPVVRRLLSEYDLDVDEIKGTGRGGRITRDDVMEYLDSNTLGNTSHSDAPREEQTIIPFDNIRKLTAEHMLLSKKVSPHVLQAVEADFFKIDAIRSSVQDEWRSKAGFSLTYLPFIVSAVCETLKEFPKINAEVKENSLFVYEQINIGIAVDLDFEGLVVPVIKNAASKSLAELATEIHDLSSRARKKKLLPEELTGGTYTISNSGPFGTLITAPIINQPQVAILSMDGVIKKPVVISDGECDSIAIRPIGVLAQSFDHRAFDGAYSASFLRSLSDRIKGNNWKIELDIFD
ncbi:MAG: dehydrogenase [Alphaproteobacteria bacterium]|jgi:pyruvate dehydrogenase E2 component (dihydrolipoamide acetyltransferase)|nr:dehydrogenase [Alphaproteobacteria bacterium]PPR14448.1 MAG: Dihydrolipoyllysine-residue succinyltransferase component of 2-oxoglutarate dehydrogenase complex [Alphaproteobacteria bacterium MarineAlpha12_Bin1]|tara:strand:- start:844 stop:2088 length:1245 start_codon:yes stop_codon:yes gene_type:complete